VDLLDEAHQLVRWSDRVDHL